MAPVNAAITPLLRLNDIGKDYAKVDARGGRLRVQPCRLRVVAGSDGLDPSPIALGQGGIGDDGQSSLHVDVVSAFRRT